MTGGKLLYLFGGPRRDTDGLPAFCEQLGFACDVIDIEFDKAHDLCDQHTWETIVAKLPEYDAFVLSPPCSTFSPARNDLDG